MMYEIRKYYQNRPNSYAFLDKECSVEKTEVSNEKAVQYMELLEAIGYKRHENNSSIFYDIRFDDTHSEEVIFYK